MRVVRHRGQLPGFSRPRARDARRRTTESGEQGEPLTGIEWFADEWPIWRIVHAKLATLQEIGTYWSLADVRKANDLLDAYDGAERRMRKKQERSRR